MNKEEAEIEVEKLKSKPVIAFCPLIKDTCREDCECYVYPRAVLITGNGVPCGYHPNSGYCGNAMFNNECTGIC